MLVLCVPWLRPCMLQVRTCLRLGLFVFVFKQKTAYEMRISDWSSDVCSSDLRGQAVRGYAQRAVGRRVRGKRRQDLDRLAADIDVRAPAAGRGRRLDRARDVEQVRGVEHQPPGIEREPRREDRKSVV